MGIFKMILIAAAAFAFSFSAFAIKTTPEETVMDLKKAASKSDWAEVYHCFSKDSQQALEKLLKMYVSIATTPTKKNPEAVKNNPQYQVLINLEKLTGVDFFVRIMEINPDSKKILGSFDQFEIIQNELVGNKIALTLKTGTTVEKLFFIKENNQWKIDITNQLNHQPNQ